MGADDGGHQAKLSQIDRFKQAARALECDDDETRFDERVKKLVKQKPAPEEGE